MNLIFNLAVNLALLIEAFDFGRKFFKYFAKHRSANATEWLLLFISCVIVVCSGANILLLSSPIGSEVLRNAAFGVFYFILLKYPKTITKIIEDENDKPPRPYTNGIRFAK